MKHSFNSFVSARAARAAGMIVFSTATLALTACGGAQSPVTDLKLRTYEDAQQNKMIEMQATVKAGNLQFPSITLPIRDPKDPNTTFGTVSLQRSVDGNNVLTVAGNLSAIEVVKDTDGRYLPNGAPIPVVGLTDVIGLQAGEHSKVYLGLSGEHKMLGVAVAIPAFDEIAANIPGANLFFELNPTMNVRGLAGVFTSAQPSQSGLGLFVDIGQLGTPVNLAAKASGSTIEFTPVRPESRADELRLQRELYMLQLQHRTLEVH